MIRALLVPLAGVLLVLGVMAWAGTFAGGTVHGGRAGMLLIILAGFLFAAAAVLVITDSTG